jgi:glutathione S-transferase
MMILRSSPPSPFGRKVKISASVLGLSDRITVVATSTMDPQDPVRSVNPLGKIPVLELEDGTALFDSRVIVEFLDHLAGGGRLLPLDGPARFATLTMQALADGLTEAALLQVYELRLRDETERSSKWMELQAGKVSRSLAALETAPPSDAVDLGAIAVACALGYLDLRFGGEWRRDHPRLVEWLDHFSAATPAYEKTRAPG